MIVITRRFRHFSMLFIVTLLHIIDGLFFGNPQKEIHFIIGFTLFSLTSYFFIDVIFLPTIQRIEKFWEKKFGVEDNSFVKFVEDDDE